MIESLSIFPLQSASVACAALPDALKAACGAIGRTMPVQSQTLQPLLAGRDLLVLVRTGSGKTGAFVMPALLQAIT